MDRSTDTDNTPYTADQRSAILTRFRHKPGLDPKILLDKIEATAAFYKDWANAEPHHSTKKSLVEREFQRFRKALVKLLHDEDDASAALSADRNRFRRIKRGRRKAA